MAARLRRIVSNEDERDEAKERAERADYFSAKLHAFAWVVLSGFVAHYSEIVQLAMYDRRVIRWSLYCAEVCLVINTFIIAYLTLWYFTVEHTIPRDLRFAQAASH